MEDDAEKDELTLSQDTLAALQEFYSERDMQQKKFEDLKSVAELSSHEDILSMEMFTEDWNSSQFWYSEDTATTLAKQLLEGANAETSIAIVSAPSVLIQIKNILASGAYPYPPRVSLFEFDERFAVLQEFIYYDFHAPLKLDPELKGKFNRILCDPPFLSDDCQTKAALTVRWLSKPKEPSSDDAKPRVIVCTGERMESLIHKVYPGTRTTNFEPQHAQGRLSNEFRCYANYECEAWSWM
ncbi:MAG: hypothetical protein Q9187_004072 [Circinaria calcarea]